MSHYDEQMNELLSVGKKLRDLRLRAGLTQAQVAECLQTKQSVIARMEADTRGSVSLRRLAEYTLACGMIPACFEAGEPLELHFIPLEDARQFTITHTGELLTWKAYLRWKAREVWKDVEPLQQVTQTGERLCLAP